MFDFAAFIYCTKFYVSPKKTKTVKAPHILVARLKKLGESTIPSL